MLRFLCDAVLQHLTEHSLLNDVQHGFVPKRAPLDNAEQNMSTLPDKTRSRFFWTSEAFDVVNHRLILAKLSVHSVKVAFVCGQSEVNLPV